MAVKKWRHYLLGRHFEILTNQKSIKELISRTIQTPEQHFYLAKLLAYDYSIHYKPGGQNRVADALSRLTESSDNQYLVLVVPQCDILSKIQDESGLAKI